MEKFTKGEWHVDDYRGVDKSIRVVKGNMLISYTPVYSDEDIHNNRLMAAAPEMYKLLDSLSVDLQIILGASSEFIVKDINKLLAKARGE